MSRQSVWTSEFKDDLFRAPTHRKCDVAELGRVMSRLIEGLPLESRHRDHSLQGRYPPRRGGYVGCRECHVCNDWLLIYRLPADGSIHFLRTGTHADLF